MKYLISFLDEHNYPKEAEKVLTELYKSIQSSEINAQFRAVCDNYMSRKLDAKKALCKIKELGEIIGTHEYTISLLFWICCSKTLKQRYDERGIDKEVFFDTMEDLRYKTLECMQCEEIVGTFVGDWFNGFFIMERFALGRFQYEMSTLYNEYHMPDGTLIVSSTPCLDVHIPSSGVPLTDEIRLDSYKRAYKFFEDMRVNGVLVLACGSWLLYEKHRVFLPEKSNILRFMNDFDIVDNHENEGFGSGWRVFGKDSDLPFESLPEKTSLQRAYKAWLIKHGVSGGGHGVIIFDGEKIVNRR